MPNHDSSPVLVVGHLRPDTDSAASAVAYASLLNRQNRPQTFEGVVCGNPIPQTRWLFEQAGLALPRQVASLRPLVGEVMQRKVFSVGPNATLGDTIRLIQEKRVSLVPVIAPDGQFCGALSDRLPMSQFFYHFNMEDFLGVLYQFDDLVSALRLERWRESRHSPQGKLTLEPSRIAPGDVLLAGDDPAVLDLAANRKATAVVVCVQRKDVRWQRALRQHARLGVYRFRGSLMALTSLLPTAIPVENVMARDLESLSPTQPLAEVRSLLSKRPHALPVLDDKGKLLGLLSRSDALAAPAQKVILVDHFERHQAIDGLDEAEIVEIVDHHRVGALETHQPIRVDCRPVGSTATIIACKFFEQGQRPAPAQAKLLLGAIVADTLLLTSPTTTRVDRQQAAGLARIARVNLHSFGREVLVRNDETLERPASELVEKDLKEFSAGSTRFAVAQVETVDRTRLDTAHLEKFATALRERRQNDGWEFAALLVTDMFRGDSLVLFDAKTTALRQQLGPSGEVWAGCVSRKKQFLPQLLHRLNQCPPK